LVWVFILSISAVVQSNTNIKFFIFVLSFFLCSY